MVTTLFEATEMIGLPILLVSGFVLVVVLALLMVILRKEKTYEDVVRERERKLGDFQEGAQDKGVKLAKKKITHKPKKPDLPSTQSGQNEITAETNASEEEIIISVDRTNSSSSSSPKLVTKQKKPKKQSVEPTPQTEFSSAIEEISVQSESLTESVAATASLTDSLQGEELPAKKKSKSKAKARTREEVPVDQQNGDINWSEMNGHETDQYHYLTTQINQLNSEREEILRSYKDLSAEQTHKDSEIHKLKTDLNTLHLSTNQQINNFKKESSRLKQQLQSSEKQAHTITQMQEELDRRKTGIDTMKAQNVTLKTQCEAQVKQLQTALDKKDVERSRLQQDRDAYLEDLNDANLNIASLTSSCNKLERQAKETPTNSSPDPTVETALNEQIASLQSSLETAQRESGDKQKLEEELQLKQENISQQQLAIEKLQDEINSNSNLQSVAVADESVTSELERKVQEYEQKIEELSEQLETWEESVSSLQEEISKLKQDSVPATELEELQRELSEKESHLNRLTVLVENSQEELKSIGDIMNEFQDLKQKTEDLQVENESLQARTDSSQLDDSSVADLASNHAILQASIKQYEEMIELHKEEKEGIQGKLGALEQKMQEKEDEMTQSKEDTKVIQERLDSFKKKNNELRETVWKTNDALDNTRKEAELQTKSTQDEVKVFLEEIFPNMRAHGQEFQEWIGKMKGAATDYILRLGEENKSASESLNEAKLETEKERIKIRELIDRDNLQTKENEDLKQTIKETEEDILLLQSQVEEEFTKLKGELSLEQQKASETEVILGEKEVELNESMTHSQNLNVENKNLKQSILPELEKSLKKRDSAFNELTYQMDSLSQRKEKLENDLASSQRQTSDHLERTNSLQAENDSLTGMSEMNQGYKQELADAKELIKLLQSNQSSNPGANREQTADGSTAQLKEELSVLNDNFLELQKENDVLRQQNRELETQMETNNKNNNNNDIGSPKPKKVRSPKIPRQPSESTAL